MDLFMSRAFASSFSGLVSEIPGICVDNFENPDTNGAKAYFLSHFHTDHTVGLTKSPLRLKLAKEKDIFIYATKLTAALIVHNTYKLEDYVKVLNLGSTLITIPGNSEQNEPEVIMNVTLVPAGHCLGSTMFLFETTSVKVLYTGDFRIRPNDLSKYAAFHDKDGEVIKLDALYVDTTFLHTHETLPKRSDSIEEVIALIRGYLDSNEDQYVVLDTSAHYGYEYVFNQIYKELKMKVYIDKWKFSFYSTIQHLIPGVTNNDMETRIFLKNIPESRNSSVPPKRIKFSALRWNNWNEDKTSISEDRTCVYVCFSTHCSGTELNSFIDYLNPAKVVGFPNAYRIKCNSPKSTPSKKLALSPRESPKKQPYLLNRSHPKDRKVDPAVHRKIFS